MKKYIYIGIAFAILIGSIIGLYAQLKAVKFERDTYKNNTVTLLSNITTYRTKDSLNAISVGNLELKLSEYKKYRDDDLKLIESLKVDKNRLEKITTAYTQTIYDLKGEVRDSFIYVNNFITDTLKCITINEKWFDLDGCSNRNKEFTGTFQNRDSLLYVEHIVPKRFWFIKWGVKERRQEIVSRNPNTKILGAEFVTIRK